MLSKVPLFADHTWLSASWERPLLIVAAITFVVLWITLRRLNRKRPTDIYDPQRAWLRAGQYFIACFVVSWATGVLPTLLTTPFARPDQTSDAMWLLATVGLFAIVLLGYGIVWRGGTASHSRPLFLITVIPFGILWGLSAGQLLLSVWALVEMTGLGPIAAAIGTYLGGGMLNGLWHSKYWDIRVSPDHNILETNTQKIILAHTPNLTLCLVHMVVFANPHVFVLAQVGALTISTWVMHFPPFWGTAAAMVPQHKPEGRPRADLP